MSCMSPAVLLLSYLNIFLKLITKLVEMPETAGEWWNADPEAVINQALQTGGGPNVSDAYTINGLPGPLYNCSAKGIFP